MNFSVKELTSCLNEATDGKRYRVDAFPRNKAINTGFNMPKPDSLAMKMAKPTIKPQEYQRSLEKSPVFYENPEEFADFKTEQVQKIPQHARRLLDDDMSVFNDKLFDPTLLLKYKPEHFKDEVFASGDTYFNNIFNRLNANDPIALKLMQHVKKIHNDKDLLNHHNIDQNYINSLFNEYSEKVTSDKDSVSKNKQGNTADIFDFVSKSPINQKNAFEQLATFSNLYSPEQQERLSRKPHIDDGATPYTPFGVSFIKKIDPKILHTILKKWHLKNAKDIFTKGKLTPEQWETVLNRGDLTAKDIKKISENSELPGEAIKQIYKKTENREFPNPSNENLGDGDHYRHQTMIQIARNIRTPKDLLHKLSNHELVDVKHAVASHPFVHQITLDKLANQEDPEVLNAVIRNPRTNLLTLHNLAHKAVTNKEYEPIISQLVQNENLPAKTLDLLADKEKNTWEIAKHKNVSQKTLHKMAKIGDHSTNLMIAQNEKTHPDTLDLLSKNQDFDVYREVASNKHTLPSTLNKLSSYNSRIINHALVQNQNTPPEAFYKIYHSKEYQNDPDWFSWYLVRNPNAPKDIIEKIYKNDHSQFGNVRAAIKQHHPDVAEKFEIKKEPEKDLLKDKKDLLKDKLDDVFRKVMQKYQNSGES